MARGLSWFKHGFEFEALISDNGHEFKGSLEREHPFETFCQQIGLRHYTTRPYRPQTNGKVEAFFRILKKEFFRPNTFENLNEVTEQMGGFLFEYNHLRRHGGLNYLTPFDKLLKVTIGQGLNGKVLVVVHTYRKIKGKETVRIISARKATKHEEAKYFEKRG